MMKLRGLILAAVALWMSSADVRAQSVEEFYSKNTLIIISAFNAGGSNDVYCRAIARFIGKHIPGKPNVIVQNMPGAATIKATNYLWSAAPKDGSVIGNIQRTVPLHTILDKEKFEFDIRKFTWLGSSSSFADDAYVLFAWADADAKTIEDLRKTDGKPLIVSGTAAGSTSADVPILLRDILGLNFKVVLGYADSPAEMIAMERKEVDGRITGLSTVRSAHSDWLNPNGKIRPLLQYARETRHPSLPTIPTARELARNDAERQIIEISEFSYKIARPFIAPPGLPADRAAALQKAFMDVHSDPEFLAEANKLKIDVSPIDGKAALDAISVLEKASPDVLARIKKALEVR
jgi:tripartite-type tricarboxylate transporter receptor subunit TctC